MKAHGPTHQHDKRSIFQFLPGPIKIKDGLFIGDEIAARDIQFIISNKVTHVINTVSKQIPNLWERFGIHYLSVNWTDKEQNIFDKKNNAVNTIFHFVEEAMEQGESCLIHSVHGKSRSCAVLVAYLIKKYSWSLNKCLEFASSKKQNLEIRNNYLQQMQELEQRMSQIYNLSSNWGSTQNEEELVLKNTLTNAKTATIQKTELIADKKNSKRISWGEKTIVPFKQAIQSKTGMNSRQGARPYQGSAKSILKGDPGPDTTSVQQNEKQRGDFEDLEESEPLKGANEGKFIHNINGNIVNVTVNNFITSDKKPENQSKSSINTRPYSSDQKDRDKQRRFPNGKKPIPYDTNALLSFKSPYDTKFTPIRGGSHNKMNKNQRDIKSVTTATMPFDRPQSAKNRQTGFSNKPKEELIVTNGLMNAYTFNKKKYPVTNTREQLFRKR